MSSETSRKKAAEDTGRNCVELEGELAKDADVRELPSGTRLALLTLRVPMTPDRKTSVPVTVWDPTKSVLNAVEGRRAEVSGRLVRRFWRGEDGSARSRVEIVADKVRVR